jgi:hypothetical protein
MLKLVEYKTLKNLTEIKDYLKKKSYLFLDEQFIDNLINSYKVKFYFIISFDVGNRINGILFYYTNKNLKNNNIGYTFFDGFIFDEKKIGESIILKVKDFMKKNSISLFYINSTRILDNNFNEEKKNYIIKINLNDDNLNWDNKPGVFRTEVRKAIKREFIVKNGQTFRSIEYYNLYLANQIKKKVPIHTKSFFFKLLKMKSILIFSCEKNDQLAGYALLGLENDKAQLLFSNISRQNLSHGVNQLIFWEIIKFLSKNSVNSLILGPSKPDGNTAFFKKKIGGMEINFYQYQVNLNTSQNNTDTKKSDEKKNKIKDIIIKYLPNFILKYVLKQKRIYGKIF